MAQIDEILKTAVDLRVSDIHFSSGEKIWARLDGDLVSFSQAPILRPELETLLLEILTAPEREKLAKNLNIDKSYFVEGLGNFRVNVFYTRNGIASVIRTLPAKVPTIEELGLPSVIKTLAEYPKGLILVTGPTGSGKSTTLASIINHMNLNFPYHILTAEDPIEFIHTSKKSLINQREIGQSCLTFADALKYALREDPDVILVGEMRDLETISLAITAAETGHLVLGTLHTRGAAPTIDRVIESFPAIQQPMVRAMLAESLLAVISQTLIKKANGKGRVGAYEIMVMNYAISNLVREGKTYQIPSAMQTGRKEGMMLMDAHVRELEAEGQISKADAEAVIASLSRGGQKDKQGAQPPSVPPAPPPVSKAAASPTAVPVASAAAPATASPEATKPAASPIPVPSKPISPAVAPAPASSAAKSPAPAAPVKAAEPLMSMDELGEEFEEMAEMDEGTTVQPKGPPGLKSTAPMKFKPLNEEVNGEKTEGGVEKTISGVPQAGLTPPPAAPAAKSPSAATPPPRPAGAPPLPPKNPAVPLRPIPTKKAG